MKHWRTMCALLAIPVTVLKAQDGGGGASASIAGIVFDSLSHRPMAQAVVQLARLAQDGKVERVWSAATDSSGHYAFETLPLGSYLIGFQHLAIDTLGFRSPVHRVDVRKEGSVRVLLAVPTMQSIVTKVCGKSAPKDSLALLVGSVRKSSDDATVAQAFVSIRWAEVFLTKAGMVRETPTYDLKANDEGWYMACVPSAVPVTAHAEVDALRSGDVAVVLPHLTIARRDLYVGRSNVAVVGAEDTVRRTGAVGATDRIVATGDGRLRGVVRALDGKPIVGARVSVAGTVGETRTDSGGAFILRGLPEGSRMVEVRALGFWPDESLVEIVGFRDTDVRVTLNDLSGTLLDTVRVRASARMAEALRAGFERRRRSGTGTFIDENVLDTLKAHTFSDIVKRVPGVVFYEGRGPNDGFERQLFFSGGGRSSPCLPAIFLDGARLVDIPTDLDLLLHPANVRRVEVYMRGIVVPAEFQSNQNCGVLAVWTTPKIRTGR